jgi:hypothetical protein
MITLDVPSEWMDMSCVWTLSEIMKMSSLRTLSENMKRPCVRTSPEFMDTTLLGFDIRPRIPYTSLNLKHWMTIIYKITWH